ncbi:amino acid adenylation domain-containing protein [Solwaraspora sp. WMMD1047]|uniref:amino acid adenylation domain-containing protein n=1 Tax=Solwaraspora sp. WMMD1047 TaxID=3016102 RepID=UPI002417B02C|nr:amino acid adenylation domain-containing protein [Solwaraspora sp. WMMD1047]MDG4830674.1 amino acid adenylation domain-containing protein [Solwaraspora sp. WMMD1047]
MTTTSPTVGGADPGTDHDLARVAVGYADLVDGLRTRFGDAPLTAVLLAAHVKVLGMLAEERGCRADLLLAAGDRGPRRVELELTDPTWRGLVERVWRMAHAATPLAADAGPAGDTDAILVAPGAAAAPAGYRLRVEIHNGHLLLRAMSDAVSVARLEWLAALYRAVLAAMAAGPDDARRACLPPEQRRALLGDWAAGPRVDRDGPTVVELIAAQAERRPDATAVRYADATMTYRELQRRSNQIAHHLIGLGAGPDNPVGVCLRRQVDLLAVLLGIWKAGAAYVPLDPDHPVERLRHMIGTAGCRLVVSRTGQLPALGSTPGCRFLLLDQERADLAGSPATPPATRLEAAHLAYVIYTSGSTGAPKGVLVQHGGLRNYLLWTVEAYASRGRGGAPFFASLAFDLGIPSLYTPLLTGEPVHLLPDPLPAADLGDALVAGAPYSFIKLTPGQLNLLSFDLDPEQAHRLAGIVIAAGDAFPAALARRWRDLAGPGGTLVATEYGPTEITIGNSGQPIIDDPATELVPLGTPIPNTTMYVLTDRLEPTPVGVAGEIHIGGLGVARGYLGDPALTADRFRPDPFGAPGVRLYRSGDLGRWLPDGTLEFLGRVDHQVKIRGYRVELGEIRAILRDDPQVRDAVVLATGPSSRPRGLAAFVIAADGEPVDVRRLRAGLAARLPEYMIPADFVAVREIPLTANGKVDTRALLTLL